MFARPVFFLDDTEVQAGLDAASQAAIAALEVHLSAFPPGQQQALQAAVHQQLAELLCTPDASGLTPVHGRDAFGDPFRLEDLPLARPGAGYAVQKLGGDTLLDRHADQFLPVRHPGLQALFPSFETAFAAARNWLKGQNQSPEECPLAIVPAGYDSILQRHVLIYGVLTPSP